ncbi:hypothetical protein EA187_14760 [Lujinxingia sediminis]|uniref:Uncharacterized protein n=1 Tax=Lujinxingia sediminis TaxID=2480984 RepID=A0ABY0CQJ1_9DELT|nr:hypothetical protein [Lujinxingia sediminis]RVU42768.1 hypothetical protein EA187_14760 [Lujinxingia sediminis]
MSSSDSTHRREQACALLQALIDPRHLQRPDQGAALRHLALASLNLSEELSAEALIEAGEALPLVALYDRWAQEHIGPAEVSRALQAQGLLSALGTEALHRRLERAHHLAASTHVRRTPRALNDDASEDDPRRQALELAAEHDRQLRALASLEPVRALDRLMEKAGLLASAMESPVAELQRLMPPWEIDRSGGGLRLLDELERACDEECPPALAMLTARSRDFEKSLAQNLESQGLLVAVRAALAFGPRPGDEAPSQRELRHYLAGFTLFADDPALLALTQALMETRHRMLLHLQGALPLSALKPWTLFLRGDCAELADSRDISLREATHYAHYCLHLLNLCDLTDTPGLTLRDALRRSLMSREEELRELVLLGQRQGLSDQQADLARFEQARWRAEGPRAALADRLARLTGAWVHGEAPGPLGASPRLDAPSVELARKALENADASADALANMARDLHLIGHDIFQKLDLEETLRLMALALASVRDCGLLHREGARVDLRPLADWLSSSGRAPHHRALLRTLLLSASLDELLSTDARSALPGIQVHIDEANATLRLSLKLDPNLDALLTLLAATDEDDPLAAILTGRLRQMSVRPPEAQPAPPYSERKTTESELSG